MVVTRNCIDLARGLAYFSRKVSSEDDIIGGLEHLMSLSTTGSSVFVGSCFGYVSGLKFYFWKTFGKRLNDEISNYLSLK